MRSLAIVLCVCFLVGCGVDPNEVLSPVDWRRKQVVEGKPFIPGLHQREDSTL